MGKKINYTDIIVDMEDIYSRNIEYSRLKGKTILITGAYGMLASELVYFLIYLNEEKNYDIKIVVAVRNKEKLRNRFGEFCDKDYFATYLKSLDEKMDIDFHIDYIIHAASLASPQYYELYPVDVLKPNVLGTYHLLEYSCKNRISGFLLFSTGDIYGKLQVEGEIVENIGGYTDTLDIHSCYGESKRMAETMCKAFAVQYNVPAKIARIFHTYGPTMDVENDPRVFASFVSNIMRSEDIVMHSSGNAKRSFCYITDAVAAYIKILLDGETSEAYNVCNSKEFLSIKELAELLVRIFPEKSLKVATKERKGNYIESRASNEMVPSNRKVRKLGAEFRISCEEGFKRVISYLM